MLLITGTCKYLCIFFPFPWGLTAKWCPGVQDPFLHLSVFSANLDGGSMPGLICFSGWDAVHAQDISAVLGVGDGTSSAPSD